MESLNQTDALEYCSYSMEKLMELSTDLVQFAPVKSDAINIPEEDVISFEIKD